MTYDFIIRTSMGLKLHCFSNLLNSLLKHNYEELSIALSSQATRNELECRFQSKNIYFNNPDNSMDSFVERCNTESIKNMMLKHEEIFKQQVQELHRLYQVQKLLMTELRCKEVKMNSSNSHIVTDNFMIKIRSSTSTSGTSHSSHASPRNNSNAATSSEHKPLHRSAAVAAGLPLLELSNCLEEHLRTSKVYVLPKAVEGESPGSCSNDECNLDLTLSIGCASDNMKSGDRKQIANESNQLMSSNFRGDSGEECINSSGGFGAESLKRPHWIFQALSLKRT